MESDCLLDSSALLALILGEPGHQLVAERLGGAAMSAVNLSEVIAKLVELGAAEGEASGRAQMFGTVILPFTGEDARGAGALRRPTRAAGLGLGDRACFAVARRLGLPVLTADRAWAKLDVGVEVVLIR